MKQKLGLLVLWYLRLLAKLQLKKIYPDIIGITGSAGKTSCRNAVYAILKDKYKTKMSEKANSESGIPLDILGLHPTDYSVKDWLRLLLLAPLQLLINNRVFEKYIVEMGVDSPFPPKNMEYLLTILRPRTAIFLNVLPMHSQTFDAVVKEKEPQDRLKAIIHAIALEKGKMIASLPENGLAILNADDPEVVAFAEKAKAPVLTFGKKGVVQIERVARNEEGTTFYFQFDEDKATGTFEKMILSDDYGYTFAAALAVAIDEGMTLQEGMDILTRQFELPPGRMSLIEGVEGSMIIDSSYNGSNMLGAIALAAEVKAKRKLALLGDMREHGEETKTLHETVARKAAQVFDKVYFTGPEMKRYALPVLEKAGVKCEWVASAVDAADTLKSELRPGDWMLVKGSQNTLYLEAAVERLMKHPERADAVLCRRGVYWDSIRAERFGF